MHGHAHHHRQIQCYFMLPLPRIPPVPSCHRSHATTTQFLALPHGIRLGFNLFGLSDGSGRPVTASGGGRSTWVADANVKCIGRVGFASSERVVTPVQRMCAVYDEGKEDLTNWRQRDELRRGSQHLYKNERSRVSIMNFCLLLS